MPASRRPATRANAAAGQSGSDPSPTLWKMRWPKEWLLAAALVMAVFLVYRPAWQGGFLWDDAAHVTRPELRSWQGLSRMWFEPGATQQYYPLLYSAFWVEYKLWGETTLGYHLVSISLHAAAALLVALVLRRLAIPGAYLAAAIFALHPVQVESVAWITEQKNTLSAVFYLGAALVYLRFDRTRKTSSYCWAMGLFVLSLLSKTVTVTLPAALLVIFWWQRGRLSWKKDVLPLTPFFLVSAAAGILVAWVEIKLVGAEGAAFELTLLERGLLAGRAIWFYLGKLVWPADLLFVYPRWHVSQAVWWQYLFPAAALLVLVLLWGLRRRWRAPLAGWLFFVGTLFPVLGFCNVYLFIYTYVADHFQYLASLGIITLASAGAALLLERWGLWHRPGGYVLCLGLLAGLGSLTFQQSRMYGDIETLYRVTLAGNPDCWMAHNNLGMTLADQGRIDEAIVEYRHSLKLNPNFAKTHNNLGKALADQGRRDEAIQQYRRALELSPDEPMFRNGLGKVLVDLGRIDEATAEFQRALEVNPNYPSAQNNLANILLKHGEFDEAIPHYRRALELRPDYADAQRNLDIALSQRKSVFNGLTERRESLRMHPNDVALLNDTAWLLATDRNASVRNGAEAVELARRAVRLSGGREPAVLGTLAAAYAEAGRFPEALQTARKALDLATRQNKQALVDSLKAKIPLYEAGTPFREPQQPSPVQSTTP